MQIRRGRSALLLFRGFNETSRMQYFLPVERRTKSGRYRANFSIVLPLFVFAQLTTYSTDKLIGVLIRLKVERKREEKGRKTAEKNNLN